MKAYFKSFLMLAVGLVAFASCTEENGTEPGNDGKPLSTIYTYATTLPYNPDNDFKVRVTTNNKVEQIFYSVDPSSEVAEIPEAELIQRVQDKGKQLELDVDSFSGGKYKDFVVTDLFGAYTISVVSVGGGEKTLAQAEVVGLDWEDVCTGSYIIQNNMQPVFEAGALPTTLQVCTTDDHLYRLKDVFGEGYSMKIQLLDLFGSDADGDYQFFRVPPTATPYEYGEYGPISCRDLGYWQGDAAFVTDYGYESGMYEDYSCFFYVEYFSSARHLTYGYNFFVPD